MKLDGISKINSAPFRKNVVQGGDFSINPWQRGTTFSNQGNVSTLADRFIYFSTIGNVNVAKTQDAPTKDQSGVLSQHCLDVSPSLVWSGLTGTQFSSIDHPIEGYDYLKFAQKPFTLSFWCKHTKAGIYSVGLLGGANNVQEYQQLVANTWEKKTLTFVASPSAGSWDYTNAVAIRIRFTIASANGANSTSTFNSWISTAQHSVNQVNGFDNVNNHFRLALIQLETGNVATAFEERTVQEELLLCQRWYEKSYNASVVPATTSSSAYEQNRLRKAIGASIAGTFNYSVKFRVPKRTTPTVTLYSTVTGAAATIDCPAGQRAGCTATDIGENGFSAISVSSASANAIAADSNIAFHWAATSD